MIFAALSDPIRLRILALLAAAGELCVCEITRALEISQPKASKHLSVLRDAGLLQSRRDAQWVLYAMADAPPAGAGPALDAACVVVMNSAEHRRDAQRLRDMGERPARIRAA